MSDTSYSHEEIENKWYKYWESIGAFKADPNSHKPPFCIILPPPNVTGVLHMGHALVDTIQDILIRYKRLKGYEAFWVPGTDHAGISTQTVVERHLMATEGKRRIDYPREEFLRHMHNWKEIHQDRIISQLKKLGCSCDWSRLRFSMDKKANKAVKAIFKKMFDNGLIYQGDYLVNWDPITQTALADDEVEYEEKHGCLWHFTYPIVGSNEIIEIATTRPETMLGDTAIAVSPSDERYQHLIGKKALLPLVNREIPIIADHYVDKEFGTGAVKITPAHDFNDYEVGMRHKLRLINIMTVDGKIDASVGLFTGLSMQEAREAVVEKMKELGYLKAVKPHTHRVGISYRSKAIIEPYLSKQWFVKISAFKEQLIDAVKQDKVKIVPDYWKKTYFHWIENLRDWCISRQLWWGHRIPIWHHKTDPSKKICYIGDGIPPEAQKNPENWEQDEDVLDTWFSSALWPFSSLGWPEDEEYVKKFYPNATLVTGHDILFFWVARMIFMGIYQMDEVPFHETFIHGLIYAKSYWRKTVDGNIAYVGQKERLDYELGSSIPDDVYAKWEKMSKSKGNVIDPIEIIDSYGADAMRMALCSSITHARQIDLDRRRFEEFKNFSNKLWNASRFIMMNVSSLNLNALKEPIKQDLFDIEDYWILHHLNHCIESVETCFNRYDFDEAARSIYQFFWDKFCAYYLELTKVYLFEKAGTLEVKANKQKILLFVLLASIRLMHPITPFITEEIFAKLKKQFPLKEKIESLFDCLADQACIISTFPKLFPLQEREAILNDFAFMENTVHAIRNIRAEMGLSPSTATNIFFVASSLPKTIEENKEFLRSLVKIKEIEFTHEKPVLSFSSEAMLNDTCIVIPLPKEYQEKEKLRLEKSLEKLNKNLSVLENKLANPNFVEKAPEQLVAQTKEQLISLQDEIKLTEVKLKQLS